MNIIDRWHEIQKSEDYISIENTLKERSTQIFLLAIGFRIAMYLFGAIIMTMYGEFENGITFSSFLQSWKRWDANGYLSIAENGYSAWLENGMYVCLVFYPMYSWLVRFAVLFLGNYVLAGLAVSTLGFGVACVYFDKLMCLDYSEELSGNAILGMAVFPFSFFFGAVMTESVFVAISTAFFYYLRKHNWTVVTILGFFACLTKVQGILLTLPVLVEILYHNEILLLIKERKWKRIFKDVLLTGVGCVPMLLGFFVYLWINYAVAGNPFIFLEYQNKVWGQSLISVCDNIKYIFKYMSDSWYTSVGMCIWIPESILIFVYLAAIVYGIRHKMRPLYIAYLIVWFVFIYSASWLLSAGRYTTSALPLFMIEGKMLADHPKLKVPVLGFSFALMVIYYSGYLTGKQIM